MTQSPRPGQRVFATTHWSLVVRAQPDEASQSRARKAMEELCTAYWYPLYSFVRSRGHSANDAQDLTQSFFARIIETDGFAAADPERGRFRSYLLGAMKHFLANEWRRARTQKRGGGVTFLQLDSLAAESRYALEPSVTMDPEAGFGEQGKRATWRRLLVRWAVVWLPLFLPLLLVAQVLGTYSIVAVVAAAGWLLLWIALAVHAVMHPTQGLHDRLAGVWVVRR